MHILKYPTVGNAIVFPSYKYFPHIYLRSSLLISLITPMTNIYCTALFFISYSDLKKQVELAFDKLCVLFGCEILKIVPGRVSTEVDAG